MNRYVLANLGTSGKSLDNLTTDSYCTKWYQAAICQQHGKDININGLEHIELKEMFDDPNATQEMIQETVKSDDDMVSNSFILFGHKYSHSKLFS
jgi:hypothetical protein